jgi:glycosyltransferase involved in cell wall biosynthesis
MPDCTIVCCAESSDPSWRWIEGPLAGRGLKFEFSRCQPRYSFEQNSRFNLARLRGSWDAVRKARRSGAKALVAHGPTLAAWCALFARVLGVRSPIIAHSFNFSTLPTAAKRWIFSKALSRVELFVVYSTMERDLYSRVFRLPPERFDVVLWGVRAPEVDQPLVRTEEDDYVCAIGGNARDYPTLIAAVQRLPHIRFVVVARPENFRGLDLPVNLTVRTNIPFGVAMNVLLHSRFMVLPLFSSEVPCGHVTLVAAMHLGKAFVITDSTGVRDYVRDGENALTVGAGRVEELVEAVKRLWADPALCVQLGNCGQRFASSECSEEQIVRHFLAWLRSNRPGLGHLDFS